MIVRNCLFPAQRACRITIGTAKFAAGLLRVSVVFLAVFSLLLASVTPARAAQGDPRVNIQGKTPAGTYVNIPTWHGALDFGSGYYVDSHDSYLPYWQLSLETAGGALGAFNAPRNVSWETVGTATISAGCNYMQWALTVVPSAPRPEDAGALASAFVYGVTATILTPNGEIVSNRSKLIGATTPTIRGARSAIYPNSSQGFVNYQASGYSSLWAVDFNGLDLPAGSYYIRFTATIQSLNSITSSQESRNFRTVILAWSNPRFFYSRDFDSSAAWDEAYLDFLPPASVVYEKQAAAEAAGELAQNAIDNGAPAIGGLTQIVSYTGAILAQGWIVPFLVAIAACACVIILIRKGMS